MAIIYDYSELLRLMEQRNYSLRKLSETTGIALSTLSDKFNNRTEFKGSEMQIIADTLGFKDVKRYFFTQEVLNNEQK